MRVLKENKHEVQPYFSLLCVLGILHVPKKCSIQTHILYLFLCSGFLHDFNCIDGLILHFSYSRVLEILRSKGILIFNLLALPLLSRLFPRGSLLFLPILQ
jgi:hypothetical protein